MRYDKAFFNNPKTKETTVKSPLKIVCKIHFFNQPYVFDGTRGLQVGEHHENIGS